MAKTKKVKAEKKTVQKMDQPIPAPTEISLIQNQMYFNSLEKDLLNHLGTLNNPNLFIAPDDKAYLSYCI